MSLSGHYALIPWSYQCANVLLEKEKRGRSYTEGKPLEAFSREKTEKMVKFIKEYSHKMLKKLKDKGKLVSQRRSKGSSSTPDTPASAFDRQRSFNEDESVDMVQTIFNGQDDDDDDDEDEDADMDAASGDRAEIALAMDDPQRQDGKATPNNLTLIQEHLDALNRTNDNTPGEKAASTGFATGASLSLA